jgi:hypothetical protein
LIFDFPETAEPFSVACLAGSGVDDRAVLAFERCSTIGDCMTSSRRKESQIEIKINWIIMTKEAELYQLL